MDQRSAIERTLWDKIGPPLYYCADCLRAVKVQPVEGAEPVITRPCKQDCGHGIIAPRKAITAGEGGLSFVNKVRVRRDQIAAAITGRCA